MPPQILLLRDPGRRPADWNETLTESQRAVFLSDVRNGAELTLDGRHAPYDTPSSCLVFDSTQEAESFCLDLVKRIEHMKCDIYNRRGAAVEPSAIFTNDRYRHRLPNRRSAYGMIVAGALLIGACPLFIYWDWRSSGALVFPTLIGLSCFVLGLRLFDLAYGTFKSAQNVRASS